MSPSFALMACTFNTVMNALNVSMSLWGYASNAPGGRSGILWGSWTRALGLGMFCLGSFVETFAELQRKAFKDQPANKGKVYMGGFFGMARHINYGGYLVWRTGFAIFSGGLPWGAVVVSYFLWYFSNLGVPALDAYCSERVSPTCPAWLASMKRSFTDIFSMPIVWCCMGGLQAPCSVQTPAWCSLSKSGCGWADAS